MKGGLLVCLGLVVLVVLSQCAAVASASTFAVETNKGLYANVEGEWMLLHNGEVRGFGVSPTGERVAFTPFGGEHSGEVLIENLKTESIKVVSTPDMGWSQIRFTPGGQIVGSGYRESEGGYGIYLMNDDGSSIRQLVAGLATWPVVSSKGALAYLSDGFFGEDNLYILDPSPSGKSVPRLLADSSTYGTSGGAPSFSPNGELILFPRSEENYVLNLGTEGVTALPLIREAPEWEATLTILEIEPFSVVRYWVSNEESSTIAIPPSKADPYRVRAQPAQAEVEPPRAISKESLLQELAPELKYDSQEPYFADSAAELTDGWGFDGEDLYTPLLYNEANEVLADPFFEEQEFAEEHNHKVEGKFGLWLGALSSYYPGFSYPDPEGVAQSGDWVDEHNDTHMADAARLHSEGYGDVAYGRMIEQEGQLWLQYWFWYYYNNGQVGFGDHEGDWEMVQVHLDSSYEPDEVVMSAHSHAARCDVGEFSVSSGGGPVVYVANGSHASYPEEGEYETEAPIFADTVFPDEEEVPSVVPAVVNLGEAPGWLDWPGRWGGSESSPQGPAWHEDQWSDPNGWAEEAEGCLDRKVGPALRASAADSAWTLRPGLRRPIQIVRAKAKAGRVEVVYRAAVLKHMRKGWPKLMVSLDSAGDRRPPRTVIRSGVKRGGRITFPAKLGREHWRVRASLVAPQLRSKVVTRGVRR